MTIEQRRLFRRLQMLQQRVPNDAGPLDKDMLISSTKDVLNFIVQSDEPSVKTRASLQLASETLDHFERYIEKREASWHNPVNRRYVMAHA